jgi:hypothetical protein
MSAQPRPIVEPQDSERSLLGALMLEPSAFARIAELVNVDDFAREDHRITFGTIVKLAASGYAADRAVVVDELFRTGQLEAAGGREYLAELTDDVPGAMLIEAYARRVRESSAARRRIDVGRKLIEAKGDSVVARHTIDELTALSAIRAQPLALAPVSAWASRTPPAARDWFMENLIPAARVTSLLGDGGLGKTLLGLQIGLHGALNRPLFGIPIKGGPVLGIFCEDEEEELHRRLRAACACEDVDLHTVDQFVALSRDGMDSILCTFERDRMVLTDFYRELEATVEALRPRLVILDTAADLFAGDFISMPHVRQFLKTALGGLCVRHGCAVLLLAHPSQSGKNSGDGGGFSVAWHNSVRSRLYLRRPKSDDPEQVRDRRIIEVKKANLAADGTTIAIRYSNGCFVPDDEPLEETPVDRSVKAPGKLAFKALEYIRSLDPAAARFGDIHARMSELGELPTGPMTDASRKQLNRALKELRDREQIRAALPRGSYRVVT